MSGQELGALLKARGWPQRQFARHIGVSAKSVTRWVLERWPVPRSVELVALQLPPFEAVRRQAA